MGFSGKQFSSQPEPESGGGAAANAPADPAKHKNPIKAFDAYGRELSITREQWRDSVLPGTLKKAWGKPDELYSLIVGALRDGFRSAVIEAAEHLYEIDPDRGRAACIWGIVLMEENRLDEAENVFRDFLAEHGQSGVILTNLAKIYSTRGDTRQRDEILWQALEVDPNQDNAGMWFRALRRERDGQNGDRQALDQLAALKGSWRAQVWLARYALEVKQLPRAMALYQQAVAGAGKPVPTDLLIHMSGDLGNHGLLAELLEMTTPLYDVHQHGLAVGNNLIKANITLGRLDSARRILNDLYACKRPDWKQTLGFWDTEIAKANVAGTPPATAEPLKCVMIATVNPIWLPVTSPAAELFPPKSPDEFLICFLGSSATVADTGQTVKRQLADDRGRLTRALPLFLAEQVHFRSQARVESLIPLLVGANTGFVLSGVPWSDADAVLHAKQASPGGDYVVVTHLVSQSDPWMIQLRLLRTADGKCLANLSQTFAIDSSADQLMQLSAALLAALQEGAELPQLSPPPAYQVPPAPNFGIYLLRLEQLLAVRCATMRGVTPSFLNGEREIIDGNIKLCLACPTNPVTRIVLAQTVRYMNKVRPQLMAEFEQNLALLEKEKPLGEPTRGVINRILADDAGK